MKRIRTAGKNQVNFRLPPAEYEQISKAAAAEQISITLFLRQAAKEKAATILGNKKVAS